MKRLKLVFMFVIIFTALSAVQTFAATSVTAAITAQNNWTDELEPSWRAGFLNISVSGTWAATVTLQRSFDDGLTWHDVDTWTANTQQNMNDPEADILYRLGVDTGDFTSGTVDVRLSK